MQPDERDKALLADMHSYSKEAIFHVRGIALDEFLRNIIIRRAVERSVEIVGEAASKISDPTKASLSQIPWAKVVAVRNRLAHDYGGIDPHRLWSIVQENVPELISILKECLGRK